MTARAPKVLHAWESIDIPKLAAVYARLRWRWKDCGIPGEDELRTSLADLKKRAEPENYLASGGIGVTGEGKVFFDPKIEALYSQP